MEDKSAAETAIEVEVDGDRAVADGVESTNLGADEPADEDAEGHCHWELVAEEPEATLPTSPHVLHLIEGQRFCDFFQQPNALEIIEIRIVFSLIA
jgi:hypothetical protein